MISSRSPAMRRFRILLSPRVKLLLAVAAPLSLLSVVLYWDALVEGSLSLLIELITNTLCLAGIGLVVFVVALWTKRLPLRGGWIAAAIGAWLLFPVLVAPIAVLYLYGGLVAFYHAPLFDDWYAARLGVTVTPEAEQFDYSDCVLRTYSAAYTITAEHDVDLLFVLANRNDVRAESAGGLPAQSLASQFERVGGGPIDRLWKYGTPLGVFHIPAGAHTLVMAGASPLLLEVYNADALWSPPLYDLGAERYHTVFADARTWADFEAAAGGVRPPSCTPKCTRLDVPPAENDDAGHMAQSASLGGVVAETLADADGDGFDDALDLAVSVTVTRTGDYLLEGSLYAPDGAWLDQASYESPHPEPLCTGVHTVTLRFDGPILHFMNKAGPYTLKDLALTYANTVGVWPQPAQTANYQYITAPYALAQFAGEPHTPFAASSRTEDPNGNQLYDQLAIDVTFYELRPSLYRWSGDLRGADGCKAGAAEGAGALDGETAATFGFPGGPIRSSGCDGPYTLADVTVTSSDDAQPTAAFASVHRTPAYRAAEFDTTSFVAGRCAHPGQPSRNDNERYDRLEISASVQGLDLPSGEYDWQGSLLAPGGALIDTATGGGQLAADGAIDLTFSGAAIRTLSIDGPYTLGDVTITSRTAPTATVSLSELCSTDDLAAWQFQ